MGWVLATALFVLVVGFIFSVGMREPLAGLLVTLIIVLVVLAAGLPIASALAPHNTTELVCEIDHGRRHYSHNTEIVTPKNSYILDAGKFAGETYVNPYSMAGAFTLGHVYKITYHTAWGVHFATAADDLGVKPGQTCG